ncbi:uncharacterized protein LOC123556400 isoform X2 [Mercenaria mercenaria]|uniref:uncharacterized protein LOC123556400 isoform X2 n=1 Tax=Mercenaria mercenaria TaxID=6596 RepID=UPI00234E54BE|nr:uncharacterized protein LOC123556400 isoform X2 [Mercenaria mercenaria]
MYWLKAAQAMETLGIIGLLISISISVVILCSRQDKTIRVINITIVASSGIFILIGVTVFGIKTSEDTSSTNLSGEFSICVFSGVLCLLVCPLLLHDYVTYTPNAVQRIHPTPVQVINQGHVMIRPPGNSNAVINTVVPQPVGYMPTYTQAYHTQPGYIVPTQITQYLAAQQQAQQNLYGAQYS